MWHKVGPLFARASSWLLGWSRPHPIDAPPAAAPEVDAVLTRGYEIIIIRRRASARVEQHIVRAVLNGRPVGRLDVDYIRGRRLLYVANVHVAEAHGRRGVGAALVLSAALTTACAALVTSGRTCQGKAFFARCRPMLARHGVQLWDRPPSSAAAPAPASLSAGPLRQSNSRATSSM